MRLFIAGIDGYLGLKGSVPFLKTQAYSLVFFSVYSVCSVVNAFCGI